MRSLIGHLLLAWVFRVTIGLKTADEIARRKARGRAVEFSDVLRGASAMEFAAIYFLAAFTVYVIASWFDVLWNVRTG